KDALRPNLVQTLDRTPALIHCGPFANIAHGTCSIIAITMAQRMCDYTVVEAGFGSDLGAEKFIDIVARSAKLNVDASVLVVTVRALKMHGGAPRKAPESGTIEHLKKGLANLAKHIENMNTFAVPPVVALNVFTGDTREELDAVKEFCTEHDTECAEVRAYEQGSDGAVELANMVCQEVEKGRCCMKPLYGLDMTIEEKIHEVATKIYGADRVVYTPRAEKDIRRITKLGLQALPVCIAKTNMSLSDNPELYGRPEKFKITIRGIAISSGAGFLVPLTGEVMLMPGLSRIPNAERIDIDNTGMITGLS
ncbi:formate--tetrahydrofolate ligase, partial [candidate division WOR-3 bacterium]|nr:formate--tetrahydrofolate ligase [candidate division WOR-3 bacterium]